MSVTGAGRDRLGSLVDHPELDDWISLAEPGRVIVRSGKVELGQGIRTALTLLAAEELRVDPAVVEVVSAATGHSPDEGYTAGSQSMQTTGAAVRQAAAHAFLILRERAARHLGADPDALDARGGRFEGPGGESIGYWDLAGPDGFARKITEPVPVRQGDQRRWVGHGMERVDLRAKICGRPAFVQDLRLPQMRFGRVIRPRRWRATLAAVPPDRVGNAQVIRDGDFVAVVAESEGAAARAADELRAVLRWAGGQPFPLDPADPLHMQGNVRTRQRIVAGGVADDGAPSHPPSAGPGTAVRARYTKPFLLHGSIGPSAAVALWDDGQLRVWSSSQGISVLRLSISAVAGLPPDRVHIVHTDGSGCYGHNGADDAALDAVLVALRQPGLPVSLRWDRADEHRYEPLGPAMVVDLAGRVDASGRIQDWCADICTYPHNARPRPHPDGSRLLGSWSLAEPFRRPPAEPSRAAESAGHRNAQPAYQLTTPSIVEHIVDDGSPLRTSALRSLGATANVFAIESFVDELAEAAALDPIELRLRHLADERARHVIQAAVAMAGGLRAPAGPDPAGRGLGYARYKNSMTYVAVVVELTASAQTGQVTLRRAWIAADAGEIVDPDGLVNQLEGGFVQAASWALYEEVRFDADGVSTDSWDSYPIMRFSQVPDIHTQLLDRPAEPPLGAGEASCGPAVAAIANALAQYTGVRLRDLPFSPERLLRAVREAPGR